MQSESSPSSSAIPHKEVRVTDVSPSSQQVAGFCDFLSGRHGCVLKAWRRVLDPAGTGWIQFSEFAEALARVGWHGDTSAMWAALLKQDSRPSGQATIGLFELSPTDDRCISHFRRWATAKFNGAVEMFTKFTEGSQKECMTFKEFSSMCADHGFQGDAHKIFHEALDIDGLGEISMKDFAFLEEDTLKRKLATDMDFVVALEAAKAKAKHIRRRNKDMQQTQDRNLADFRQKVRQSALGSFIRGWRHFDKSGNLIVSKTELLKGLKRVGFEGDPVTLWRALDLDDNGTVELHEVEPRMAMVLARFKRWAVPTHGSCAASLQKLGAGCLQQKGVVKMTPDDLERALKLAGFSVPGVPDKQAAAMLHEAFDGHGVGSINGKDATFLDRWDPVPWLCIDPDDLQKEQFISLMRQRYGNLLVAWRKIDKEGSNKVSYKEFCDACTLHRLTNWNVTGIWTVFDPMFSGFIALRDLDPESADVLSHFKDWAEGMFGTMQFAFKIMDHGKTKSMTYPRLKRALQDYGYGGNAKVLFESLKPETSGSKRRSDVRVTVEDFTGLDGLIGADSSDSDEDETAMVSSPSSPIARRGVGSLNGSRRWGGSDRLKVLNAQEVEQQLQNRPLKGGTQVASLPSLTKHASAPGDISQPSRKRGSRGQLAQTQVCSASTAELDKTQVGFDRTQPGFDRAQQADAGWGSLPQGARWGVTASPGMRRTQIRADLSPYRLPSLYGKNGQWAATERRRSTQGSFGQPKAGATSPGGGFLPPAA